MSKEKEIGIDDLPAPGEPLVPDVHEENLALLENEIKERARRLGGKLTPKEHKRLTRRYTQLWKKLKRANYNDLIKRRWRFWQLYQELIHEYTQAKAADQPDRALIKKIAHYGRTAGGHGRKLNDAIAIYQPWADEFTDIARRLRAHDDALEYEKEDAANRAAFMREARVWEAQIKAVFRQSARLHHAWQDTKGHHYIDIPRIEQIIMKDDRVLYQIQTSSQNPIERLLGKWHSALPYNVDIHDLTCEETLENLAAGCNRVVTVERSKRGTNLFYAISRLDSPDGIPKRVLYSKVIDWYPVNDHAKTPWAAGVTNDRKAEYYNLEDNPHILIAGSTKSGKSNHLNQMIATFVTMNSPSELRLVLIDNKGGIEFTHWQGIKHQLRPMIKQAADVLPALQFVRGVMERRLSTFEAVKAKNLASYNAKVTHGDKLARIVVVIDEMATLLGLGELTNSIQNELRVISSQGRAVGIHVILCTQHSSVDVIPGWVKTNMVMRVSGKMPSHQASMVILDSVTAATLPNLPGRLVFSQGRFEVVAQSPYISDDEVARAVTLSQDFPDPDNREFESPDSIMPKEKFTRDDLLDMALDDLGGKLSPSRIHERVGNEVATLRKLRFMVEDLIDEGLENGIMHRGQLYKLRKDRKSYIMELDERADEPKSDDDTAEVVTLEYSDAVASD